MRNRLNPAEALVRLPREHDASVRQASWRQALAALSQSAGQVGPPPLDGIDQRVLESSVHVAIETGLIDDLDWIAPGSAAVALYEMSSALPSGQTKRDLRRRVFTRLYGGDATAFSAVATRVALGAAAPLRSPTMRARVALLFDLPIGTSVNASPLALALATRRDLRDSWIREPSTQALPSRRLAAQLLEHAAREAVLRAQLGDTHPLDLLLAEDALPTFRRLLADREPLVWRHVAVARGLLATVVPRLREQIESSLDPTLSPTEWRRSAVSLVATLWANNEEASRSCRAVLDGPLTEKDPGLAAAMVLGLPRVIEAEPDRAEELLDRLATTRRSDVATAVAELFSQMTNRDFATGAAAIFRDALTESARTQPPVPRALASRALELLTPGYGDDAISARVRRALIAFETEGAERAYGLALEAAGEAHQVAEFLETHDPLDEQGLPSALAALQNLDAGAIETPALSNLLLLGRRPGDTDVSVPQMERLYGRVSKWVLAETKAAGESAFTREGAIVDQRSLRALLHLVDTESSLAEREQKPIVERLRAAMRVLLERLAAGPDAMVHRILCAALARTFDAAVRENVAQASDIALVVAASIADTYSITTIAEASTNPAVAGPIGALAQFLQPDLLEPGSESTDTNTDFTADASLLRRAEVEAAIRVAGRVIRLSQGLSGDGNYRCEALRRTVFRLGRTLEAIAVARGQSSLVDPRETGGSLIDELDSAIDALTALNRSARRRVLASVGDSEDIDITTDVPHLSTLLDRAIRDGVPANQGQIDASIAELVSTVPSFLARPIQEVLSHIAQLPAAAGSAVYAVPLAKRRAPLPDWLLPRRTIGSFYVVRALGSGGVSSVFLARRHEERHDPQAEAFALKVPEYDPTTARSLSEQEFFQLFRDEAGALLSLPSHENLARFVTFDLAARPKPILVMELISGNSLDRFVRSRSLRTQQVCTYLDGVLAGLEAMHEVGVGHLDVKPSNVILREGRVPVLVDFGLSGRQLRPGCGTLEYTAPEVLGVETPGNVPAPPPADIYALGCMTYELLTGELLFDADDELALVSAHVSHDGWPDKIATLAEAPGCEDLAHFLGACLRRDPRIRPTATQLREELQNIAAGLDRASWPVDNRARRAATA